MAPAPSQAHRDEHDFDLDVRLAPVTRHHAEDPTKPSPATETCGCPATSFTRCGCHRPD
ncbi:MAG TPA: hypothetical protein VH231_09865 [Solirubrobacteraceae bacterium]|jgi:hypothetical protein|nr:hypothetical protein [Solirubrobacteraceae bacterium]